MKPQQALRISLTTLAFMITFNSQVRSGDTKDKRTFSIHTLVNTESSADHSINLDLTLPSNDKKQKESDQNSSDLFRHKRHADENRHDHHHHHFDKVKSRKKIFNLISALALKIFIAVSYFSILLCSYMSLCHH